jgi:hypothetical protein
MQLRNYIVIVPEQWRFVKPVVDKTKASGVRSQVAQDSFTDLRFQISAVMALQEAISEAYLVGLLEELVSHPRQESHHHAKGHPIGSSYPRRTRLNYSSIHRFNLNGVFQDHRFD